MYCYYLLPVLLIVLYMLYMPRAQKIRMYGDTRCSFCKRMRNDIKKQGLESKFKYIEVSEGQGKSEFSRMNVQGVPHFVMGEKTHTGYLDPNVLVSRLS